MLYRSEEEYKRQVQDLQQALAKAMDEAQVLRDNKIEYLLGKEQENIIRKMRESGVSEQEIAGYTDLRRVIRQSDSANSRATYFGERSEYLERALQQALALRAAEQTAGNSGHMHTKVYTADGFQISINLPMQTAADALKHMDEIRAAGLLPAPIEPPSTEETETIATVVRREHVDSKGNVIPVIDLYPDWRGLFGQYRFSSVYLDTAADIAQFEAHAGVKLDSLPIYESQSPLMRKSERPHRCEIKTKPFVVVKKYTGDKEVDGKMQRVFKFSHYVSADGYAAAAPKPVAPAVQTPAQTASSNPFDAPAVKDAISAAIKNASLTGAGLTFLFSNIIPGKTLARVSDAYPDITPDEFLKRLPKTGEAFRAHLDAQTQPDPDDDDPKPSGKPSQRDGQPPAAKSSSQQASATGDPFNPPRTSTRIDTPLNGGKGSSTRKAHPLEGERLEIESIEAVRDRRGFGWEQNKWVGKGKTFTSTGVEVEFVVTIWPEDARKLREAGHIIDWPSSANEYAPFITHPNPFIIAEFRKSSGLCIRSAEPVAAVHKHAS